MKKYFVLLVLALASCSSSEDASTQTDVLVTKIIESFEGGDTHTTTYQYNGNKLSSALTVDDDRKIVYTYNGNLLTQISYRDLDGIEYVRGQYSYDNAQRLSHFQIGNVGTTTPDSADYTYNADGTISVAFHIFDHLEMEYSDENAKYFLQNGDIVKIEKYLAGGTGTSVYTYDTKNNPYKNITGIGKLLDVMMSTHNILSGTTTASNGDILQQSNTTLDYDDAGYPVSTVQTGIGSTKTTQYFYE